MNYRIVLIFYIICSCFSCNHLWFEENTSSDPVRNFEVLWKEFDLNYSYFENKKVNWDSIYMVYRAKVTAKTTDPELFDIVSQMTGLLKDGHVSIDAPIGYSTYNFHDSQAPTINWIGIVGLIRYMENLKYPNGAIGYGKLKNRNIGYIQISTFGNPLSEYRIIDDVLRQFESTKGLIIDLRMNGGGSDKNYAEIVSRFADKKRLYRKVRYRNGPQHTDFTDWIEDYIESSGTPYLKSIMVLTNEYCYSATEDCILAFRELPYVTIVGDTTGGGSGNPILGELPNGWIYTMSNWQMVNASMISYEGTGIPPDSAVWISKEDSIQGIDRILEKAIELIDK